MPEFGVLIIKNPGPNTDIEIQGLAGYPDEDTETWDKANAVAEAARAEGHLAKVLTAFDPDEGDGSVQVEMYNREEAAKNGCIPGEGSRSHEKEEE